ncbi:MAG: hypothetical protein ACR2JC_06635 [Chloroflexota bacterium]
MPRITPLTAENAPEQVKEALHGTASASKRIQAYWPPLLEGVAVMDRSLDTDRLLPESTLRLAKLRSAQVIGCPV